MTHISDLITSSIETIELHDHCSNVVKIVRGNHIEDPRLNKFTEKLSMDNKELKVSINQERKSEFTPLLKALDEAHDRWFRCLTGHVRADLLRPVKDISKAAKRIYQIIKNHGLRLFAGSYEKESTLLESLFVDLDLAPRQGDLRLLGMEEVYTSLKLAQIDFNNTYLKRINTLADKEEIVAASYIQKTVKHRLEVLIQYIDVMVSAEEAPFERLAKALDELTDQMNQKIRTRLTAEANKKKKQQSEEDNTDQ